MKRIIALILLLCTVAACFVGCTDDGNSDDQGQAGDTTTVGNNGAVTDDPNADDKDVPKSDNPVLDFGEETIKVLSRSYAPVADEIAVEAINGNAVNDAVYNRNIAVEKKLNVKIENDPIAGDNYAVYQQIKTLHGTGDAEYDFFSNSVYSTIMYTAEGLFADLTELDYLELDKPWFAQNFIDVATNGDSLYMVTGSLALSMYRYLFVTFFNEQMVKNVTMDTAGDLYDVVTNGDWTIDYQISIAEKIHEDYGAEGKSEEDTFGFITNGDQIGVDPYWSSCELKIIEKTDDGWFRFALDIERLTTAVDKIKALVNDCPGSYSYAHQGADTEQETIRTKFASGGAAMATLRLVEAESAELRNMKDVYGVLPMPKLEKSQDTYYSYAHDQLTAFGVTVLVRADEERFQRAGAVLNEMNYQSLLIVQPDYYELTLKAKYMNNEKSWAMLDLIVKNLYIDAGVLYTKELDSIHQKLRTVIGKDKDVVSTFGNSTILVSLKLEELVDEIKAMQDKANS